MTLILTIKSTKGVHADHVKKISSITLKSSRKVLYCQILAYVTSFTSSDNREILAKQWFNEKSSRSRKLFVQIQFSTLNNIINLSWFRSRRGHWICNCFHGCCSTCILLFTLFYVTKYITRHIDCWYRPK